MVSGFGLPLSIGTDVSQCADATSTASGRAMRRPSAAHVSPTAPGSTACIGEPCDRNNVGNRFMFETLPLPRAGRGRAGPSCGLQQMLGLERLAHVRPRRDARLELPECRPASDV